MAGDQAPPGGGSLSVAAVGVTYRPVDGPPVVALSEVSFTVAAGQTMAIMGPSGSGKSTLLKVLAGRLAPDSGEVSIGDQLVRSGTGQVDERVAVITQDYRLIGFLTVAENIELALELSGRQVGPKASAAILTELGVHDLMSRFPEEISGGQRQRVAIARALLLQPALLVADEPTGSVDTANTMIICELLAEAAQRLEFCLVVATHDRRVATAMSDCLVLDSGRIATR